MKRVLVFLSVLWVVVAAQGEWHGHHEWHGKGSMAALRAGIGSWDGYELKSSGNGLLPAAASKKNAGLAILYSLVLPGMGELYAEGYESGKYFTIAEAALWVTYGGMRYYSNRQRDSYFAYAESYGGVRGMSGKNGDFYADIGNYLNINDFNDDMAKQGQFAKMYDPSTHFWSWRSNGERKGYRELWTSSESWGNNLRFVVGGMILNRIASAINAVRLVARYNKGVETTWNFWFDYDLAKGGGISLNFVKGF
ncbi:MAG: hypothetical protein EDM75_05995 [Chlorobiota bacterium]|nr:MAG: hypothetical protein EDM75_05995 [Chlorobiota bacterium]